MLFLMDYDLSIRCDLFLIKIPGNQQFFIIDFLQNLWKSGVRFPTRVSNNAHPCIAMIPCF